MDKSKLRQPVSLSLTEQEAEVLEILQAKGIKIISVFRCGLSVYEKQLRDNNMLDK